MCRLIFTVFAISFFLSSCDKLGVDYPYDREISEYSDAYEISLILEPINAYNDPTESMVMGNLQNGTSYSFETGRGLGYEVHLAAYYYPLADSLCLESIFGISKKYSQATLWAAKDANAAHIEFKQLGVVDTNKYIFDGFKDEFSYKYMLDKIPVISTTSDSIYLDQLVRSNFTDSVRYYAFESNTTGTNSDSRSMKGVLIITKPTVSTDFIKVNMKGRVMYKY